MSYQVGVDNNIELFLNTYKPSLPLPNDWLWVHGPNVDEHTSINFDKMYSTWNSIIKNGKPCAEDLDKIANECGCLHGKWMIRCKPENIDIVWAKIVRLMIKGVLGCTVKVGPYRYFEKTQLICVYTRDFLDEIDVMRVRKALYDNGFVSKLYYKPDVYTYLGIDSKNKFKLKASRYTS